MNKEKGLVVYYSRNGATRSLAEYIANTLSYDIEEIIDLKNRGGPIGWLSAGRDATNRSLTEIKPPMMNPKNYGLVIIGTPIWNGTISTPIRTYITQNRDNFTKIAVFSTGLDRDPKALEELKSFFREKPLIMVKLDGKNDVKSGDYVEKISEFIQICKENN